LNPPCLKMAWEILRCAQDDRPGTIHASAHVILSAAKNPAPTAEKSLDKTLDSISMPCYHCNMSNKNTCQLTYLLAAADYPKKHMSHGFAA